MGDGITVDGQSGNRKVEAAENPSFVSDILCPSSVFNMDVHFYV